MREQRQRSAAATRTTSCWAARVAVAFVTVSPAMLDPAIADPAPPPLRVAQASKADGIRITVPPSISARSASQAPLQIRIASSNPLPRNCFVRVRGLPSAVSLSEGHAVAPGAWAVPLNALASLQMVVPAGVSGRVELSVSLVGEDGALLADAKSTLLVELSAPPPPAAQAAGPAAGPQPPSSARPSPPVLSPADREAAEKFLARGEQEIEKGQIAVARNFFLRAAQLGLARGALLLAATYDPRELARWRALGIQPNLEEARKWYQRARELGAPEAEERLARLGPG
jgi:hypothetical protein